ncbi:MAG: site-specific integrase [Planctomycetes bacterium]|nr:site-specific integrase [Planctomycetota bacterium]MCO5168902.1 site-specific integrase [Planctomycetota bacterium]
MTPLAPLLEAFFTERLFKQRQASPHTISAYRDTFRLLLTFAQQKLGRTPSQLELKDLDAPFVSAFLDQLQGKRGNSVRTRNARLAAIRSFFRYLSLEEPGHAAHIQRVLGIPQKRSDRNLIGFLNRLEVDALLSAPDTSTWIGRRDHTLLLVAVQTGLRVSELVGLCAEQLVLTTGPHVRCRGKGRKERCTPLTKQATKALRAWLNERAGGPADPLFPTRRGTRLSRDAVERLVAKYTQAASATCHSLAKKRVTPHVLRHTTAVHLLQAGVDRSVIALWLGHESVETTQMYLDADLSTKEAALEKTRPTNSRAARRYAPGDRLLAFLSSL